MLQHKFFFGSFVILACLCYLIWSSFQQSTSMHLTLDMLLDKIHSGHPMSERIQLGGSTVVPGSISWDKYKSKATFNITDGTNNVSVKYIGNALLPDTFKDNALVVLEGEYDLKKTFFEADLVFAKCPSKYEGQNYSAHVDAMQETSY